MDPDYCPAWAPFLGFGGVFASMALSSKWSNGSFGSKGQRVLTMNMFLSALGAAYGTARSGIGIAGIGAFRPELIMKALIPVVMSGIIAVYGLVVAVLIAGGLSPDNGYSLYTGFVQLGSGIAVGMGGLAAGYAVGIVGDYCVRAYAQENKLFVTMVLILIFGEVLGLYGLIVALIMNTKADNTMCS
ncbi:hypothetical protein BZG36_04999 [Bifiguratus adelaidae]|uniref:V-type proton ATPase proteolipid subunit n=1 Tax=Bifiguratus adelaidae TaxID=1938954 RepID=A0A261XUX6_9FUNG|nr:hypothetical protein BZG36_04999 [Bifiguratus adelaidae]